MPDMSRESQAGFFCLTGWKISWKSVDAEATEIRSSAKDHDSGATLSVVWAASGGRRMSTEQKRVLACTARGWCRTGRYGLTRQVTQARVTYQSINYRGIDDRAIFWYCDIVILFCLKSALRVFCCGALGLEIDCNNKQIPLLFTEATAFCFFVCFVAPGITFCPQNTSCPPTAILFLFYKTTKVCYLSFDSFRNLRFCEANIRHRSVLILSDSSDDISRCNLRMEKCKTN